MCFIKKQFILSVLIQSYIVFIKHPFLKLQDLVKTALSLPEEVLCAAIGGGGGERRKEQTGGSYNSLTRDLCKNMFLSGLSKLKL